MSSPKIFFLRAREFQHTKRERKRNLLLEIKKMFEKFCTFKKGKHCRETWFLSAEPRKLLSLMHNLSTRNFQHCRDVCLGLRRQILLKLPMSCFCQSGVVQQPAHREQEKQC